MDIVGQAPETTMNQVIAWLNRNDRISFDTETTGLDAYRLKNRICGVALYSAKDGGQVYLPFRHGTGFNLPIRQLTRLMEYLYMRVDEGSLELITWNGKFDCHMMFADGFDGRRLSVDTPWGLDGGPLLPRTGITDYMLGAHLMNENEDTFALKPLADKYIDASSSLDEADLRGRVIELLNDDPGAKAWKGHMWKLPFQDVAAYAISDVRLTWQLGDMYDQALADWDLTDLFRELCDYALLVTRMEIRGIRIDTDTVQDHMKTSAPDLDRTIHFLKDQARRRMLEMVPPSKKLEPTFWKVYSDPDKFNPGSWSQLMRIFDWDGTSKDYLSEHFGEGHPDHAIAQAVLDYRVLSKMNGTYYDAYLALIDAWNILRPNYNMIGTKSGRLSCNRPNIQNVPKYSPKRRVKDVFIPHDPENWSFVEIDYAQAELRLAAHFAQETRMIAILREGRDPHGETAEKMGVSRFVGKTLNFAVIYGAGIQGLMKLLKCSAAEARDYLDGYFGMYPGFKRLSVACQQYAEANGYIRMPSGRYSHFNTYKSETRKAMNRLIQGGASEMLRTSMMRVDDRIEETRMPAALLFQVHDSLMAEVRDDTIQEYLALARPLMTDYPYNPAPDIEAKAGKRWGQLVEVHV